MSGLPSAIDVRPANGDGEWGDFDGYCTLFNLIVGNDSQGQAFHFVPSTSGFATWLPISLGCDLTGLSNSSGLIPSNSLVCAAERGVSIYEGSPSSGYVGNRSSTYIQYDLVQFSLDADPDSSIVDLFGTTYNETGMAGLDYLQMDNNQSPGSFKPTNPTPILDDSGWQYFLPTVGLGFGNWTYRLGNALSFMSSLDADPSVSDPLIPSRSWGYTAGARYQDSGSGWVGSLTLGGYDASRFDPKTTANFSMPNGYDQLLLQVGSIDINWTNGSTIQYPFPFPAVIDSTLPYLFLPPQLTQWLSDRYNLTYNLGETGLYTVDAESANTNLVATSTISFALEDRTGGPLKTTIDFPYDAFMAQAHWSWGFPTEQPIFPMQNWTGNTAVLGRAFLQQAYVSANHEDDVRSFNVSKTIYVPNTQPDIVSIVASRHMGTAGHPSSPKSKLSAGAIAGIAIGAVAGLALVAFAVWFFCFRVKKKQPDVIEKDTITSKFPDAEELDRSPYPDSDRPPGERRNTFESNWSDGTYGRSEAEATSPSIASRPGHTRQISELSSDSEAERHGTILGTVHEHDDKSDARQLEQYAKVKREREGSEPVLHAPRPMSPQELAGSTDWMHPDRRL